MPTNDEAIKLTRETLVSFCKEFLEHPYLCYTEHGQHCRFANQLYSALPKDDRYLTLNGFRICRVQKEYPTNRDLSRSRRQHWDISLIAKLNELPSCDRPYDHLPLATIVEFGLNCKLAHIYDDIDRLKHEDSNVQQGFIAHLFRLSPKNEKISDRDWSPYSKQLHAGEIIQPMLDGTTLEVYLGVVDSTKTNSTGLWRITESKIETLTSIGASTWVVTLPEDQDVNCMTE